MEIKPLVLRSREINMNSENIFSRITSRKRNAAKVLQPITLKSNMKPISQDKKIVSKENPEMIKEESEVEPMDISISNKENEQFDYEYLIKNPFVWPAYSDLITVEQQQAVVDNILARREAIRIHFKDLNVNKTPLWFLTRKQCNNEYMHPEYLANINDFLIESELNSDALGRNFLENSREVKARQRYIFINWIVSAHVQFQLCAESLYLAISLSDRFVKATKASLLAADLIVIGVVCLFIATKDEEVWPPTLLELISALNVDYSLEFCRDLEMKILSTLNYKLAVPLPISFIRHYNLLFDADNYSQYVSRYLCELSLQDYEASGHSVNLIGASCVLLGQVISRNISSGFSDLWTPKLQMASGLIYADFKHLVKNLCIVLSKQATHSNYRAITEKYSAEHFMNVPCKALNSTGFRSLLIYFKNEA